jgi:hypothetical protein
MDIYKRLLLFERDPDANLRKRQLCTPSFARGLLAACDLATVDDSLRGENLARTALRLAEQLEDTHLIARSYGALGAPLRAQGRLDDSDEIYTTGLTHAATCLCRDPGYKLRDGDVRCMPDLIRRQGHLRIDQAFAGSASLAEAEVVAHEALALATTDETTGQALVLLGAVRFFRGHFQAIQDLGKALQRLPLHGRWKWVRDMRWGHYSSALQIVTRVLAGSSEPEEIRRGLQLFPEVRKAWKGLRNISPSRATLDWTEASLVLKAIDLGVIPEAVAVGAWADAVDALTSARERLRNPVDIMAISADIAAALLPDVMRIKNVMTSVTCPPVMQSALQEVLRSRTGKEFKLTLRHFRESATAQGAPPSIFPHKYLP